MSVRGRTLSIIALVPLLLLSGSCTRQSGDPGARGTSGSGGGTRRSYPSPEQCGGPVGVPVRLVLALAADSPAELAGLLPRTETVSQDDQRLLQLQSGEYDHIGWDGSREISRGPVDFSVDAAGHLYILGTEGDAVYCFDGLGQFLRRMPAPHGPEAVGRLGSIDVDGYGRVYCWDRQNLQLVVYGNAGEVLCTKGIANADPETLIELRASSEGRVFGVDWLAYYEVQNGALQRVAFDLRHDLVRVLPCPSVLAYDNCVYFQDSLGLDTFYRFTTDMQLTGIFECIPKEGDPPSYCAAGDGNGFLYTHSRLLSEWSIREQFSSVEPPETIREHGLVPAHVSAYNPQSRKYFRFLAWRGFWATMRLGRNDAYYVLTHNSLDWGPWTGLRVYRCDMTAARAQAR